MVQIAVSLCRNNQSFKSSNHLIMLDKLKIELERLKELRKSRKEDMVEDGTFADMIAIVTTLGVRTAGSYIFKYGRWNGELIVVSYQLTLKKGDTVVYGGDDNACIDSACREFVGIFVESAQEKEIENEVEALQKEIARHKKALGIE